MSIAGAGLSPSEVLHLSNLLLQVNRHNQHMGRLRELAAVGTRTARTEALGPARSLFLTDQALQARTGSRSCGLSCAHRGAAKFGVEQWTRSGAAHGQPVTAVTSRSRAQCSALPRFGFPMQRRGIRCTRLAGSQSATKNSAARPGLKFDGPAGPARPGWGPDFRAGSISRRAGGRLALPASSKPRSARAR